MAILTVVLISFASCSNEAMKFDEYSIMAGSEGGKSEALVHGMDGKAKILYSPEWMTVSIQDSLLSYEILTNETDDVLRDCILLEKGGNKLCIPVIQGAKNPYLSLSITEVVFDTCGGTQTVGVCTNGGKVTVESIDGIDADYEDGLLTLTAAPNKGGQIKGDVTVYSGEKSCTIKALVKGDFCLTCDGEGTLTCPKCKGEGMVFSMSNYGYFGCTNCGGAGFQGRGYSQNFKRGTGKIVCPDCNGNGVGNK